MTSISFIIPHKGREQYLLQTIRSVIAQDYARAEIEIIVVTQNERLSEELYSLQEQVSLSVYNRPYNDTISALRNFGVRQSTSEYLAFLDADVELSRNWISSMLDVLNQSDKRVIASAVQVNGPSAPPLERIRTSLSNAVTDQSVRFLPGRNLLLRRETFDTIGGFPEHLVTCEDYYFTEMASRMGELYYTSAASYIHLGEDKDYGEMFRKEIWRGQSNLLSAKGRRIPLSEIPSFIVPIGLLILATASFVLLLTGYPVFAAICFIMFIFPVTAYTLRLFRLCKDDVGISKVLKFYLYYFPARAIGTIGGMFRTLGTKSHNR
jgi:glycosyltransferase involved in cell wall biosynthesis